VAVLLSQINGELNGKLVGQPDLPISGIASLKEATKGCISFISHGRYQHLLKDFKGSALIVSEVLQGFVPPEVALIVVDDPYWAYARLTQFWRRAHPRPQGPLIHPSAVIHPDAWLDSDVEVGPLSVIEAGARIGAGTRILARVTVMADVIMGKRCVLHPGVVVGADGFGFAQHESEWVKIEQLGNVVLGNDVELGANTCVDRAALGSTTLCDGVKIDNLVQIGHNVHIGPHTAMAGCVGVAGSARIGARCTFGGGAIVLGHLEVADDVHVSAASVVTKSIKSAGQYSGLFPLDDNQSWEKNAASLKQLHVLRERIKSLESQFQKKASP
jgi:UDP-3-O-[3-hydroxymyristoyl] glucosamine N-acyltransferase